MVAVEMTIISWPKSYTLRLRLCVILLGTFYNHMPCHHFFSLSLLMLVDAPGAGSTASHAEEWASL